MKHVHFSSASPPWGTPRSPLGDKLPLLCSWGAAALGERKVIACLRDVGFWVAVQCYIIPSAHALGLPVSCDPLGLSHKCCLLCAQAVGCHTLTDIQVLQELLWLPCVCNAIKYSLSGPRLCLGFLFPMSHIFIVFRNLGWGGVLSLTPHPTLRHVRI